MYYDPLIAKLIVWGKDRSEAISRARRALEEYRVSGVMTTIGFCRVVMDNPRFIEGKLSTRFIEEEYPNHEYNPLDATMKEQAALAVAIDKFIKERKIAVTRASNGKGGSGWQTFYRQQNTRPFTGSK